MNPPTTVDVQGTLGDPEAVRRVLGYSPETMERDVWLNIRDTVLNLVLDLGDQDEWAAVRAVRVIAAYLAVLQDEGFDVNTVGVDVLFDADRVASYVTGQRRYVVSRHELRFLGVFGRVLNPAGRWPVHIPVGVRAARAAPYTADGVLDLFAAVAGLPAGFRRDRLTVVLNVILGCGATPADIVAADWTIFRPGPRGLLYAHLPGGPSKAVSIPARVVPVADPYRAEIAHLAATRTGALVDQPTSAKFVSATNNDAELLRGAPHLRMTELRTTWMVDRARAGVALTDLAPLAGIKLESLVRAVGPHVPPGDPQQVCSAMARSAP